MIAFFMRIHKPIFLSMIPRPRAQDAIAEHRRAHVAHQRECALVERRAAEVALRVAEKSDAYNALVDAVSYARSRADAAYLDGVVAGFQHMNMSSSASVLPMPSERHAAMRSSQSARTLSTVSRPSSAMSHRLLATSGSAGKHASPDASNARLNAETKRQQVVTAYCRPASALGSNMSGSVSSLNLIDPSLHAAHRTDAPSSATQDAHGQHPDDGDHDERAVDRLLARAECDSLAAFFTPFVDAPRADVVVSMRQRLDVLEAHASRGGRFDDRLLPDLVQMLVDALEPNLPAAPNRAGAPGARASSRGRAGTAGAGRYSLADGKSSSSGPSAGGARRK